MIRKYSLKQVKDFIKEYYGYEWRDYKVLDTGEDRTPRQSDFRDSRFEVVAVLYKDGKRLPRIIGVTNSMFYILGENNDFSPTEWQKFLKHQQEFENKI